MLKTSLLLQKTIVMLTEVVDNMLPKIEVKWHRISQDI
jgi:hypothetical protein